MVMILFIAVSFLLAGLAVVFGWRLQAALRRFKIHRAFSAPAEAPSVSVCIPARNETHAMTQCLERVLSSDYRKMEVLVYDDESADDTSILIKSFAHAGVRFVTGPALPQNWLGKNHALEVLAREASGTYILFLDVDTHINVTTISQIVGYSMENDLVMTSVIPGRNDVWRANVLFGHLRYFWQLLLARDNSPAASSSLWMIKRHVLLRTIGGFAPHKAQVAPEVRIAEIIGPVAYRCLVNNAQLGVTYEKRLQSQRETSRRLLYPMVGGTMTGALMGCIVFTLLNLPLFVVISSIVTGWSPVHTIALTYLVAFGLIYAEYTYAVWRRNWWLGIFVWPIVVLHEFILFITSTYGYLRHTITWKGRPVMAPKMANQMSDDVPGTGSDIDRN